jgi:hypothetical protein
VKFLLPQFLEGVEQTIEHVDDSRIRRSAVADAITPTKGIRASGQQQ